jgi:hypothetical protein
LLVAVVAGRSDAKAYLLLVGAAAAAEAGAVDEDEDEVEDELSKELKVEAVDGVIVLDMDME